MIRYYLDGIEANPENKDEIEYIFDFTSRKVRELEINVDVLRFVGNDYTLIDNWQTLYGDYVGMPMKIVYSNGTSIDYLLDFSDPSYKKTERHINCKAIRHNGIDNFFDNAEGLSFGLISWNPSDFTFVDYVVIPDGQFAYFISLSLATFALAQELAKSIQEIQEGIGDLMKATIPVGFPPAPDWGAIAVAAIKLAARIVYTIFIVIALIKLVTEILNLIFPKIRQFKACSLQKLIEKGCNHLGFTLQSTLLDSVSQAVVCPVPLKTKDPSLWLELFAPQSLAYTNGYPSVRDTIQTLGQAIAQVEEIFNGKVSVDSINKIVTIENETWYEQNAVSDVKIAFNLQDSLENEHSINSDEIFKRLVANYQVDASDVNTYDDSKKSLYEISSEIINSPGPTYELIKRFDRIDIAFARGTRKGTLTFLEKAAKELAKVVDLFTGGNLSQKIEARKNVMQISSQYFGVTKLLWMDGTKLKSNQNAYLGCDVIVNTYHSNRFIENYQKNIYENMPLAATESEIFNILLNNYVNLDNGSVAEIKRISWSERRNVSMIDYTVKKNSINEQTTIINNGG